MPTTPQVRGPAYAIARHYLSDLVYGANDGIITTFAVAAGVAGANLSPRIVVILGFANLLADGFSMAASNFLAIRSRSEVQRSEGLPIEEHPARHAFATFLAFAAAGAVPLLAYVVDGTPGEQFLMAAVLTLVALFVVGSLRSLVTPLRWMVGGVEMLAVGAAAAAVSYGVGRTLAQLTGS